VFFALPNAPDLSARLTAIIDNLCQSAAARLRVQRPAGAGIAGRPRALSGKLLILLWTRLQHVSQRLAALVARAAAGRALTRRPRRLHVAPLAPIRRMPPTPFPRLPHKFAWLVRLVPEAASYGSQLRHLLAEPEMAALLAASPQASRLLRPICRMLAVAPPHAVPRPPPPDPPLSDAAAAPPDPHRPPRGGKPAGRPLGRDRPLRHSSRTPEHARLAASISLRYQTDELAACLPTKRG